MNMLKEHIDQALNTAQITKRYGVKPGKAYHHQNSVEETYVFLEPIPGNESHGRFKHVRTGDILKLAYARIIK